MAEEKEIVEGYRPGVPFAWLEWDDTYEYYTSYAPAIKITAADLHSIYMLSESKADKNILSDKEVEAINTTFLDRVLYNTSFNGFQPAFKIDYSESFAIVDNDVVIPRMNILKLKDSSGKDYTVKPLQNKELTEGINVIEQDITRSELIDYKKVIMLDLSRLGTSLGFCFSYILYDSPPELDIKNKIYESLMRSKIVSREELPGKASRLTLEYPRVFLCFEIKVKINGVNDYYIQGPFVLSFSRSGVYNLYDFSEIKFKSLIENDKTFENLSKKYGLDKKQEFKTVFQKLFAGGELYELEVVDKYFQVGSGYCDKMQLGEKEFNQVIIQIADCLLSIQSPKVENNVDLKKGVIYPVFGKKFEDKKTKIELDGFVIVPSFVAIRGTSAILNIPKLSYEVGRIKKVKIPNDTIKKDGKYVIPTVSYIGSSYVGNCVIKFNPTSGSDNNSMIDFSVELTPSDILLPVFRSAFADYDRFTIKPQRPSWWEDGFRLYPTSMSGSERFDVTEFTLGFYFPPETTDDYLIKLRKILQNIKGVYPVKLYMGYMLINEEKVVEVPGGSETSSGLKTPPRLEVQEGGEYEGYLEEDGIKDYECIKGFIYSGVSRRRGEVKGELSLSFTDRSLMLREQFVVGLPFYDGWGVNAAVEDLLFRAGFIKEKQYPNSKIYPIDVEMDSQLPLGTQKGPTYDIKMGTSFWDAIKRIIEVPGWWFFVLRDGSYCLTHPRRLLELVKLSSSIPLVPRVYGSMGTEYFYEIPFFENSDNWQTIILGPLSYNEEYRGSYNQYMIMGLTPAYTRNYEINPFTIPIIKKNPETLNDMTEKIKNPDSDKNKGFTYFPYMKNAFKAEPDLNDEKVVSIKLRQESKRLFKPYSTIEFSTFGRSIYKPLDVAIVVESDEPEVISEEDYSGGDRGIGYFLVTEVSHSMDVNRKHWEVVMKGERFYTDPDFFPYPKDFGY